MNNLKFYIMAALFIAVLTFAGVTIYDQAQELKAQKAAFGIFKAENEKQRETIFKNIDSLKTEDRALDAVIKEAAGARKDQEMKLSQLKKDYEKTNFNNFNNDSLARYFADRRRQRESRSN